MSSNRKKDLYISTSISGLNALINDKSGIPKSSSSNVLFQSASKLYEAADESYKFGDEERSYILFMRFYNVIELLRCTTEYKKDQEYYNRLISSSKLIRALESAEKLQKSLGERYESKKEEAEVANELKEKEKLKEVEKITPKEEENNVEYNDVIDCKSLYGLISKKQSVVLMDVRNADDYTTSHIKHSLCINVPASVLGPGMTAEKVQANLPIESLPVWSTRKDVDYVVLLDGTSESISSNTALHCLRDAIHKWDQVNKLKHPPLLLKGGFQDWTMHYPTVTTNPQPNHIVVAVESSPDITLLEYPDLDNIGKPVPSKNSMAKNTVTTMEKPSLNQPKDSVPQSNSPDVNDTLANQPMKTIPAVNRNLKPKQIVNGPSLSHESNSSIPEEKNNVPKDDIKEGRVNAGEENVENLKNLDRNLQKVDEERLKLIEENERMKMLVEDLSKETEQLKISKEKMREVSNMNEKRRLELEVEKMREQRKKSENKNDQERKKLENIKKAGDGRESETKNELDDTKNDPKQLEKVDSKPKSVVPTNQPTPNKVVQKTHLPSLVMPAKRTTGVKPKPSGEGLTKTKLKGETDTPARKSGLSRSHSSPNIAELVDADERGASKSTPVVNRLAKPKIKSELFSPGINRLMKPQAVDINAARQRNLMPVYGNQGPGLTGLKNLGNTCFMNSIMQCLANTIHLCFYFMSGTFRHHINKQNKRGTRGDLSEEFSIVIRSLWCSQYRSITPKDFKSKAAKYINICCGYDQQDSHEFLTMFIEKLHQDVNTATVVGNLKPPDLDEKLQSEAIECFWKYHKLLNQSVITELFEGLMCSTLQCSHCSKKSYSFEEFMCLSLPIPSPSSCSLKDCLSSFLKVENMTGEAKWRCPSCKVPRDAQKKIDICKLPQILIIHLKRFSYEGMWRRKLQTFIEFPFSNFNFTTSSSSSTDGCRQYNLYGVSNHYGTLEGGHYTAFCKNNSRDKWFRYDDHEVSEISQNVVMTSAAYILFYTSLDEEREFARAFSRQ